jgi:Ca2+-binding RTX toxin-like protein
MADLSALLAELGGDNPQNRAIAEGLQKQGINSTKDIGVRKVTVPGDVSGSDESRYQAPDRIENAYFNKKDNKEIDPNRLGIYDVKDGDKVQGNIFFHLDADDKGNVSFRPQWSPRAHGFLRDNAVGRLIMTAGKIIPSPFQPAFVAADVADKLAHGKVMDAVVTAIPYGIQEFAKSAELLKGIAGNSDFVATAKTAAGKIAEAAGAPSYAADLAGKVATSGITAGLTGENVGKAMLKAGANSLLAESKNFLQAAGDFSKMGIGGLLPEGISAEDFDPEALEDLGGALEEVDVSPEDISPNWEGKGWGEIGEGEFADEIRPTFDLTGRDDIEPILDGRDNIEEGIGSLNVGTTGVLEGRDAKGLQSLYEQENPGAANIDVETADTVKIDGKEYFLDEKGGAVTQNPDGSYTRLNAREFNDLGSPDVVDSDGTLDTVTVTGSKGVDSVKPVAYDDEGNLMPGYELDEDSNPVWVGSPEYSLEGGAGNDYVSPEGGGMVDDAGDFIDVTAPLTLPPGAGPDEEKPEEPYLLNPDETIVGGKGNDTLTGGKSNDTIVSGTGNDTLTGGGGLTDVISTVGKFLPIVPAIFPPRRDGPETRTVTPTVTGGTGNDTLTGGTGNDGLTSITDSLLGKDPLTGGYSFSWNKQQTKAPEKGIAYGQRYYGNQWSKSDKTEPPKTEAPKTETPKTEPPKTEPRKEFTTMPVEDPNMTIGHYGRYTPPTESPTSQIQFAEGGLMALGGQHHTFKPTMTDAGISSEHLAKNDVASQAIQHMRKGGHVVDHKTHKDVHYLASKGEPVHHIVGFMNHRKRMAEGGITSHSLGSYSDGGHLLKGPGDGMSDDIPATIADKQPARLANEEFVIPADVVSHLGNGSSESGAKVLYEMMARIRKARTGNPKQGKQINPHKLLPKV